MSVPQPEKDYEKWPQEHHAHGNGDACPRCFQLGVRQGREDFRHDAVELATDFEKRYGIHVVTVIKEKLSNL